MRLTREDGAGWAGGWTGGTCDLHGAAQPLTSHGAPDFFPTRLGAGRGAEGAGRGAGGRITRTVANTHHPCALLPASLAPKTPWPGFSQIRGLVFCCCA